MQHHRLLPLLAALAAGLAGCQYEEPLGPAADAKIPDEILGRWHQPADPGVQGREHDSFLVVHRTRGQRLLVDYEFQDGGERAHWYFTGHPVLAARPELIELELVGNAKGVAAAENPYLLVRWQRDGDRLAWQLLDTAKLDPGDGGAGFRTALTAALAEGKDPFDKPAEFRKVPAPQG